MVIVNIAGLTFSLGQTGRIDVISRGRVSSRDLGAIMERLPIVLAAGIRALYDQKRQERKKNQAKGEPEKSVKRARRTRRRWHELRAARMFEKTAWALTPRRAR